MSDEWGREQRGEKPGGVSGGPGEPGSSRSCKHRLGSGREDTGREPGRGGKQGLVCLVCV